MARRVSPSADPFDPIRALVRRSASAPSFPSRALVRSASAPASGPPAARGTASRGDVRAGRVFNLRPSGALGGGFMDHAKGWSSVGVLVLGFLLGASASANEPTASEEGRAERRGARPAFAACAELKAGDACRFTPPDQQERSGVCRERKKGLVCAAAPVRKSARKGPAMVACEGREPGSTCVFEIGGDRQHIGLCRGKPGALRCAPTRKPIPSERQRSGKPPTGEDE